MRMLLPPHKLFLVTAVVVVIVSLLIFRHILDTDITNTHLVIALSAVCLALAILLLLLWLVYKWTNHLLLSPWLTWVHVILALLTALYMVRIPFWLDHFLVSYSQDSFEAAAQRFVLKRKLMLLCLVLIGGQFLFLINLVGGLLKKHLNKN